MYIGYKIYDLDFGISYGDGLIIKPNQIDLTNPLHLEHLRTACTLYQPMHVLFTATWNYRASGDNYIDDVIRVIEAANILEATPGLRLDKDAQEIIEVCKRDYEKYLEKQKRQEAKQGAKRSVKAERTGYVYLIMETVKGYYKIGRSVDPDNRLKTFEVKLPFQVEYICTIHTSDMYILEKQLQDKYKNEGKHIDGEWFALTLDDVEYIKSLAGGAQ
jgi:hypothetical protein